MTSIHSPAIKAHAELHGITLLQAYRAVTGREEAAKAAQDRLIATPGDPSVTGTYGGGIYK